MLQWFFDIVMITFFRDGWSSFVCIWLSLLVFQRSLVLFLRLRFLFCLVLYLYFVFIPCAIIPNSAQIRNFVPLLLSPNRPFVITPSYSSTLPLFPICLHWNNKRALSWELQKCKFWSLPNKILVCHTMPLIFLSYSYLLSSCPYS